MTKGDYRRRARKDEDTGKKKGKGKGENDRHCRRCSLLTLADGPTALEVPRRHGTTRLADALCFANTEAISEECAGLFEGQAGGFGVGEVDEDSGEL
jgi:hypothetical protein